MTDRSELPILVRDAEPSPFRDPGAWLHGRAHWIVANAGSLVAAFGLTGLVAYGILWLAYSRFYDGLGLRPEDLGLAYSDILSQSIAGIVIATVVTLIFMVTFGVIEAVVSLAVGGGVVVAIQYVRWGWKSLRGRRMLLDDPRAALWWLISAVAIQALYGWSTAAWVMLPPEAASPWSTLVMWVGGFVLMLVFSGCIARYLSSHPSKVKSNRVSRPWDRMSKGIVEILDSFRHLRWPAQNIKFLLLSFLLCAAAFNTVLLFTAADVLASNTRDGKMTEFRSFGLAVVSWNAEPATIYWSTTAPKELVDSRKSHCLMYVGHANGTVVLYDASSKESLRVPSQFVSVVAKRNGTPCP